MPTILSHPAVPLALGIGLGGHVISRRLLLMGLAAAILPDLDVLSFRLGISYGDAFGHRGFSHSLLVAVLSAWAAACASGPLRSSFARVFWFVAVAMASHGILDTFTNGGQGVALLWPGSAERFFAPVRPIEVSPIGIRRFLSDGAIEVLRSELTWIWMPAAAVAGAL
ncbi:MAG: metal-dependent hydrolase, partial [Betaproteobacteria bacterium]